MTILTVKEVAELLRVSPNWVRQHATGKRRPVLPCIRIGGAVRFDAADVARLIEECKNGKR